MLFEGGSLKGLLLCTPRPKLADEDGRFTIEASIHTTSDETIIRQRLGEPPLCVDEFIHFSRLDPEAIDDGHRLHRNLLEEESILIPLTARNVVRAPHPHQ